MHRRNNRRNRGRLVPQLLGWGPTMSPNFLAVVFKKQEISQQVVTRMQDLASEFSKIFPRVIPPTLTAGGARPSRTQHPARPLAERGAQAPRCWDQNLGPLNFSAVVAPLTTCAKSREGNCLLMFHVGNTNSNDDRRTLVFGEFSNAVYICAYEVR